MFISLFNFFVFNILVFLCNTICFYNTLLICTQFIRFLAYNTYWINLFIYLFSILMYFVVTIINIFSIIKFVILFNQFFSMIRVPSDLHEKIRLYFVYFLSRRNSVNNLVYKKKIENT